MLNVFTSYNILKEKPYFVGRSTLQWLINDLTSPNHKAKQGFYSSTLRDAQKKFNIEIEKWRKDKHK